MNAWIDSITPKDLVISQWIREDVTRFLYWMGATSIEALPDYLKVSSSFNHQLNVLRKKGVIQHVSGYSKPHYELTSVGKKVMEEIIAEEQGIEEEFEDFNFKIPIRPSKPGKLEELMNQDKKHPLIKNYF